MEAIVIQVIHIQMDTPYLEYFIAFYLLTCVLLQTAAKIIEVQFILEYCLKALSTNNSHSANCTFWLFGKADVWVVCLLQVVSWRVLWFPIKSFSWKRNKPINSYTKLNILTRLWFFAKSQPYKIRISSISSI